MKPYENLSDPIVRAAADEAVRGCIGSVKKAVLDIAVRRDWSQTEIDDGISYVLYQIARRSIPAYDDARGTKFNTFITTCAKRAAIDFSKRRDYTKRTRRVFPVGQKLLKIVVEPVRPDEIEEEAERIRKILDEEFDCPGLASHRLGYEVARANKVKPSTISGWRKAARARAIEMFTGAR